ncbi:Gfo/Idh/MocA family protein [Paenirhodobacter populi]|uniref:Gfo/Idh/MocA family oxidoreductase n=1 Tax=Paenirhodobacter populi TaxID=2306993 RepID=A0A443J4T6_9RHOB|nr:Gfo/Idh/MocA family oxidoreductase [Sinirhodobacter populi]RWR15457.1 Gfo/Idh/MocA family oxidoreductase [Sinirhodobacter populi]
MTGRLLNWGILGCAGIARKAMIPAITGSRNGRVAAVASRDAAKARAFADELGIARACGSYDELLRDPSVDVIYNPLPNHLHVPMTIAALAAGKPVLCEKPLGLSAAEVQLLQAAQRRFGLPVAEAFMVRFHPQWQAARDLVRSGRLGELRAIHTVFTYFNADPDNVRNRPELGGGGLYDVGCYAVNTARFLLEAEPEAAIGLFERDPAFGTDRLTSGLVSFPGGARLAFTCATQAALTQEVLIIGTKGRLHIPVAFNPPPDMAATIVFDDCRDLIGTGREVITLPPADQYRLLAEAFADTVMGQAAALEDIASSISNMRVLDALLRSAATGRWETL